MYTACCNLSDQDVIFEPSVSNHPRSFLGTAPKLQSPGPLCTTQVVSCPAEACLSQGPSPRSHRRFQSCRRLCDSRCKRNSLKRTSSFLGRNGKWVQWVNHQPLNLLHTSVHFMFPCVSSSMSTQSDLTLNWAIHMAIPKIYKRN